MKFVSLTVLAWSAVASAQLLSGVGGLLGNLTSPVGHLLANATSRPSNASGLIGNGTVPIANGSLPRTASVTIKNGTLNGYNFLGVDSFLGVPFALPPVGDLRLRKPQTYNETYDNREAVFYGPGCISVFGGIDESSLPGAAVDAIFDNPLLNFVAGQSEDCLYLNVQRPASASKGSKLPVVVWIYGGAFQFGSTNMYNAQNILMRGVTLGAPFIFVSIPYRLSGFGFMPGKEMQEDDATNLGLHDQRKALEWVQENIAEFGGDPDHVILWGESAGSISVFDHMIINRGDNTYNGKALFHGGIMNSGSIVPARTVNDTKPQAVYDAMVSAAGCKGANNTLACLRGLSTGKFTDALNDLPGCFGYQSVNLPFLPRPDPTNEFFPDSPETIGLNGSFTHVPIIIGDQEDEGTLFSLTQQNISTTEECIDYFSEVFFPGTSRDVITDLVNAYPDNATYGSPFRTGDANNIYPQYKRMAAVLGDITFNLIRRAMLAFVSDKIPTWSYLNTYLHGLPGLGTLHAADLVVLFGPVPTTYQNPQLPIDYYISFFTHLDPNQLPSANKTSTVYWPQWHNDTRQMLNFAALNTSTMTDDYRQEQYEVILSKQGILRV